MEVWASQIFNGLSLSSILLLIDLGLALSFGLINVINLAHGEFIMIGAYTPYALQQIAQRFVGDPSPGVTFLLAIPLSFFVAGAVGILVEQTVIRFLYRRPLDTLLATWGVGLFLQQLARSIFGAPNVQVIAPPMAERGFGPVRRPFASDEAHLYHRLGYCLHLGALFLYVQIPGGTADAGRNAEPGHGFQPGRFYPAGG